MTETILPLSGPVAFDLQYIAPKTSTLKITKDPLSPDWDVLHEDGSRLFTIEGELMSLSHRKTVKDSKYQKMYQIRRQVIWFEGDDNKYYAEASEDGPKLWEMIPDGHQMVLNFVNHANGGKPDFFDFRNNPRKSTGYVNYHGQRVAMIHKKKWTLGTEYDLTVAQGLDMSLMMGLVISVNDLYNNRVDDDDDDLGDVLDIVNVASSISS